MRYDTGRPSSVIRLRISQPRTASLPCPAGLRARRAIADDGLVSEERVLHPALTMVPGRLLPTAPAERLHPRDRPIPRGRPRAVARDGRRPGRWDDDRRTPRRRGLVNGDRVIGAVSGDAHERTIDRVEQIEGGGRIIARRLGQRVDTDHAGLIDAKVEPPPATPAAATVFSRPPTHLPRRGTDPCCRARDGGCPSRIRCQAATGSWDQVPAVGDPTDIVQFSTGHRVAAGEGQRRVALQRRVAAYLVRRRPDARRHATLPQSWIQREN